MHQRVPQSTIQALCITSCLLWRMLQQTQRSIPVPFISSRIWPTPPHTRAFSTRQCHFLHQEHSGRKETVYLFHVEVMCHTIYIFMLTFMFTYIYAHAHEWKDVNILVICIVCILIWFFSPRMDDYNDPVHLERLSTLNFFQVEDLGAIMPTGQRSHNYTLEDYRINEWYYSWLPHTNKRQDGLTTYQVGRKDWVFLF